MATSYFLHAADLHLGSPLKSLGSKLSPERAKEIQAQVTRALDNLVATAIARKVEFVVLAGDVYDDAEQVEKILVHFINALRTLGEAGIHVFIVHGNHDPLSLQGTGAVISTLPNVTVFGTSSVETHQVSLSNGVTATVAGISFETESESRNLSQKFASVTGNPVIGVLHTNVTTKNGTIGDHANYAPCTESDLANSPVNYWALGHIHMQRIERTPNGWWAYPGNLQGRSSKNAECGAKGVLIVGIDEAGNVQQPTFEPCDVVRFERITVPVDGCGTHLEALDAALDLIRDAEARNGSRATLVRLEFVGQTTIYNELVEYLTIENCRQHIGGDLLKVEQSFTHAVDIDQLRQKQDLVGEVIRDLDSIRQDGITIDAGDIKLDKNTKAFLQNIPDRQALADEAIQLLITKLGVGQ